jgi:hypothetical protein
MIFHLAELIFNLKQFNQNISIPRTEITFLTRLQAVS